MFNLIVSHWEDGPEAGPGMITKDRYLEYTSQEIINYLKDLPNDAIRAIESWPTVLMEEGRGEEKVLIGYLSEIRNNRTSVQYIFVPVETIHPINNNILWKNKLQLDIADFEFSRNHWSVKEIDLKLVLGLKGAGLIDENLLDRPELPLPSTNRRTLLHAKDIVADWSHTQIDDFLLEIGVEDLDAGRAIGSRRDRANALFEFILANPFSITAEGDLLAKLILRRTGLEEPQSTDTEETRSPLKAPTSAADVTTAEKERAPRRVFVVHGRDEDTKRAVVDFISRGGLEPIVLHEQPNMGRHLLTKFIEEADLATFAIVIMTDDDVGGLNEESLSPRARQNVILELGYFLSHLKPKHVCAMKTPGLEAPSDFDGIVYLEIDEEMRWQDLLARELLAADLPFDHELANLLS